MRIVVWIAVTVLLGFLTVQLFNLYSGNITANQELGKATAEVGELKSKNEQFLSDLEYFSIPENLAKELKARFDYKKPGEKLIKIQ